MKKITEVEKQWEDSYSFEDFGEENIEWLIDRVKILEHLILKSNSVLLAYAQKNNVEVEVFVINPGYNAVVKEILK